MCREYGATPGHDEMCAADGGIRSHWNYLMRALDDMGSGELQRRREEAWRQIRENDVTYNIYGDPGGMSRPWQLDLVPLLVEKLDSMDAKVRGQAKSAIDAILEIEQIKKRYEGVEDR